MLSAFSVISEIHITSQWGVLSLYLGPVGLLCSSYLVERGERDERQTSADPVSSFVIHARLAYMDGRMNGCVGEGMLGIEMPCTIDRIVRWNGIEMKTQTQTTLLRWPFPSSA